MFFTETKLKGAFVITPEKLEDERGFFARLWSEREFREHGLDTRLAQCSLSFNKKKGTLRGMHYQVAPYQESKLVRCTRGSIYDVVLDLRAGSPTYKEWQAVTLTADNHQMLYIPKGCAHGFQTLSDEAEVFYQISEIYKPEAAAGVRWNDAAFRIVWPLEVSVISERDARYADYQP
ncbi:MAG TPA: dTDP-4-dehydrorhamnose 3,5-epimerase [Pyrinomonadaceae bacterium]